jgi:hypothetical protein
LDLLLKVQLQIIGRSSLIIIFSLILLKEIAVTQNGVQLCLLHIFIPFKVPLAWLNHTLHLTILGYRALLPSELT